MLIALSKVFAIIADMKKGIFLFFIIFFSVLGCARLQETGKVFWGSSTKALEEARVSATSQTYRCFLVECFDEVLSLAEEEGLTIFIKNRDKNIIVVMGIPGNVDTTEVGIFFEPLQVKEIRVDVSSLSTKARETVSRLVLTHLDKIFQRVE